MTKICVTVEVIPSSTTSTTSSSLLIQKNLPGIEEWFKTKVVITVEEKLREATGTKYNLNEYTLFCNAKDGANEQEVHMDNALLCNCRCFSILNCAYCC